MDARRILGAAAAVALYAALAQGPAGEGALQGRVLDTRGQVLPDAVVVLTAAPAGTLLRTHTKRDGTYLFTNLQTGIDYEVRASHEGLASAARPFRISNTGEKVGLDLTVGARI